MHKKNMKLSSDGGIERRIERELRMKGNLIPGLDETYSVDSAF